MMEMENRTPSLATSVWQLGLLSDEIRPIPPSRSLLCPVGHYKVDK